VQQHCLLTARLPGPSLALDVLEFLQLTMLQSTGNLRC
jgi:hypothetical protein